MAEQPLSSRAERKSSGNAHIGERIRSAREKLKMSGETLGRHLGVSKSAVSQWESGEVAIDIRHVERLSVLLGIPYAELVNLPPGAEFLTSQERALVAAFRRLSEERRASLLILLPPE